MLQLLGLYFKQFTDEDDVEATENIKSNLTRHQTVA